MMRDAEPPTQSPPPLHQLGLDGVLKPKRSSPIEVLICEPQLMTYGLPYLPVMWGVLKTYWEQHAQHAEMVRWHDPIYEMSDPIELVEPYRDQPLDVVGLSCYTWNWRLQLRIAELLREMHPDCLIVAGGPHPEYRDPAFFDKHPAIDAVVVKDGEVPFTQILQRVLAHPDLQTLRTNPSVLRDIGGLCLPGMNGELTGPTEVPDRYDTSAYLTQRNYYERFFAEHKGGVCVAWETSRGCPFKCSYCDWGSNTMSKVRRFDMDRLDQEIEWFGQNKVVSLFSVDSNFGMFKSDVELTDRIVESKQTHGYPQYFVYSNAKNVPDRTVEITRKVVRAGLDTAHTLSIQHSDERVLEATDRKNISVEKQIKVVRALQDDGIPISVQLILGLPLDTPELWRRTFTDLMRWGIHDGYVITNYHLLPNAPAAQPEYRDTWGLRTIDRYIYDGNGVQENTPIDPMTYARGEIIVETSSFDRNDWVKMSVDAAIIRGLHNPGVTQSIARYLQTTRDIEYKAFYDWLLDELFEHDPQCKALRASLTSCYQRFIEDETSLALLPMPGRDDGRWLVEPHRWLFAMVSMQRDRFFSSLAAGLQAQYTGFDELDSLCAYQHMIMVHPQYDPSIGATHKLEHDWPSYFRQLHAGESTMKPPERRHAVLSISDTGWDDKAGRSDYSWPPGDGHRAWTQWFFCIATGRLSPMKSNHQRLYVERKPAASMA